MGGMGCAEEGGAEKSKVTMADEIRYASELSNKLATTV